ncbi:MAG: hypothetical protein IJX89_04970 [Alphaproteobacteria bacterium]|nr:hypothetical protein [Alphaproteobacteria bacterium]
MLKNSKRYIRITGYDISEPRVETAFTAVFHCSKCKNIHSCRDIENCAFVKYIRTRIDNTTFAYDVENPTLAILIPNAKACDYAMQVTKRAKRLRTFKPLLRCR